MGREQRILDPTPCLVRHVRRAAAGETSVAVLSATFHAAAGAELEALNGTAGWQSATVNQALSDDGNAIVVVPNAPGDDGRLHRERFALLADPVYRIGEEWLEVYRGELMRPEDLEAVITPAAWRMDRGNLELRGPDLMALYTLARSSELDVWHHAPRDVFEHYTRLPVALLARSFASWIATGSGTSSDGWTYAGADNPGALPGIRLTSPGAASTLTHAIAGAEADNFAVAARLTWEAPNPPTAVGQDVRLVVGLSNGDTIEARYSPFDGAVQLAGAAIGVGAGAGLAGGKTKRTMPGGCSLKVLVRRRWVFAYLEGELVARARRTATVAPTAATVEVRNATVVVNRIDAEDLKPFGLRGADKGDLKLPGAPTPGGLRGRYWSEAVAASQLAGGATGAPYLYAVLDELRDPGDSRLDPVLSFASGPSWQPPAAQPASGAFSARWTGAIYLDLSGNGRRVRLGNLDGAARVWIGRTLLVADALIDSWSTGVKADLRSANLQTPLGSSSGWFPIVVEYANDGGNGAITLQESTLDGAGNPTAWADVPATRLSPIGCYEEVHRLESHRELLGTIAETFGYQWRVDPRKLESGEFPGQVIPRVRVGADTDKIVPNDRATDLASEGDAADAVDRLLVDAGGIADPKGAEQLTASVTNDAAIAGASGGGHLFLSTGAESLPEVTEPNLLEQRAASLLALRSGPNEQIAARPSDIGQELTDTFPLTGALARRRWRPGDGLRLALEDLSVVDDTPRQLLAISWPLYRTGAGAPSVGWRQRPRGLRAFLRRVARMSYAGQRNYQGQSGTVTGTFGATAGAADGYSRLPLPENLDNAVALELVVEVITGPTGTVEVNGASTGVLVSAVGRYDLTRWLARDAGAPRIRARITGATTYECHLELRVKL